MTMPNLTGKVCLVTGATRGIGRGIAVQLGSAGATVYVTGRSKDALDNCAQEIKSRGGIPIPVQMDHSSDSDVESLFDRIKQEQSGKLDVLVNNAYAGVNAIMEARGKPFWETKTPDTWDCINNVGLRGHYICTVLAARLMVPRRKGLIVNVSSPGGLRYLFNVAYGVGKAGCDRMAADCAVELKDHNVTMISLWPGPVKTEMIKEKVLDNPNVANEGFEDAESVEFSGQAIVHLAADPTVHRKTGKIVLVCEVAQEYGFTDDDGDVHDFIGFKNMLKRRGHTWIAMVVPGFLRLPHFMLHAASNKF